MPEMAKENLTTDDRLRRAAKRYGDTVGVGMLKLTMAVAYGYVDFPTPAVAWPEEKKLLLIDMLEGTL